MIISETNTANIKNKISAYIGFSIKKGRMVWGLDNLEAFTKKMHLILVSTLASPTTLKKVTTIAEDKNIPMIYFESPMLENILNKPNCKVITITDVGLATAIQDCIKELQ